MFFDRLTRMVTRTLELVLVVSLALMAILVFGNVILRYVFDSGLALSDELARLLFVWVIFLGAILASREHAHIGFDALVRRLSPRWKKIFLCLSGVLMLACCALFVIGGWSQTIINLDNTYPVLGISYAWLYAAAVVFGIGMAISIAYNIFDAVTRPHAPEELVLIRQMEDRIDEELGLLAEEAEAFEQNKHKGAGK
ncbi:TRAP transporter small permease [Thauera butanivorans]|uniref:TRAP transporter small permease n=2 Tax=Thauera butanivorans TaxID=86174 RepID=UPI000838AF70|nr:TRAP transporter small permease [Thauera butanivorans]